MRYLRIKITDANKMRLQKPFYTNLYKMAKESQIKKKKNQMEVV